MPSWRGRGAVSRLVQWGTGCRDPPPAGRPAGDGVPSAELEGTGGTGIKKTLRELASAARREPRFRDFHDFRTFPVTVSVRNYSICPESQIHRKFIDFLAKIDRRGCTEKILPSKNSKIASSILSDRSYYVWKHKNKSDSGIWCGYYRSRPRRHFLTDACP